jgi:large subunit ribosomal protein L32
MALPARHHTKSRRNKGRAHMALRPLNLVACPQCGTAILPHRICRNCGYYKGRQIVDVLAHLDKKERKKREKLLKQQAEEAKEKTTTN